ncbi:TauD/TfdA family dioxygenase [Corticibacter populi]|uniref:TauD/TfdA family dioxygenase n=1 Tax=Corticibacter populi TaxID=1550736 RepID=A0A3M6QX84_9BURK|nr:TauD/TfdA family dioxygenase [Corticibacter populi]RMX07594.1 TauD/TfdA family dioxygenase [Corticibacter populi]RZS30092.1 TfdA family taurine catabolism dioxygenase TauD [Corticibacter populi]
MSTILKQRIQGPAAWRGSELADTGHWIHHLSADTVTALVAAQRQVAAQGLTAPAFGKDDFPIPPALVTEIAGWADTLENGQGFLLLRGLPASQLDEDALATIYYGIGLHMGTPVTQNERGDLLGRVMNIGDQNKKSTRVYETNAYLPYHTDLSDVVGLLSIRKAQSGGLSSLVSAGAIYNEILEKYPEYLGLLYRPIYFDHLGEELPSLSPIFSHHAGKLSCRYLRYYIEVGQERRGVQLSRVEVEMLDLFDAIIHDQHIRLDMMLEPGDIQFANNYAVLHSRTRFEDAEDLAQRRKLLRLWLKMPNARTLAPDFPGRNGIPVRAQQPAY